MTNFEKIKAMNIEELSEYLCSIHAIAWIAGSHDDWDYDEENYPTVEFLKSEVKE